MNRINNINRRKFLELIGYCSCGFVINSCAVAPITERKQLKLLPEATLNRQAAEIYANVRTKAKLSKDKNQLKEIKQIGARIEKAVAMYFDSVGKPNPTAHFNWEYILIEDDKIKNAWCMPGGKIAVYTGILKVTKNN